jgi:hypothetical protein
MSMMIRARKLSVAAAVFFCLFPFANPARAGTICGIGILQDTANGGINPVTGNPWQVGDQYRLAFVTSGTRNATSPDIADYDAFVQSAAAAAGMGAATWRCVGQSINNPDAKENTATGSEDGVATFLVDGNTKIADDYMDFWGRRRSLDHPWNRTENQTIYEGNVATGSDVLFGESTVSNGSSFQSEGSWWQVYQGSAVQQWHFYAISDPLTVVSNGPDTTPPQMAGKSPADDSTGFPGNNPLVVTFDEIIHAGSGNLIIRNLGDASETLIAIGDATQVTFSGKILTIDPAVILQAGTAYAIRIDAGAILDSAANPIPGISDHTTWNFTTGGDSLLSSLDELTAHINGTITLNGPEIAERKLLLDGEKGRLGDSAAIIASALRLVSTYDSRVGPLWVRNSPVQGFDRPTASNEDIHWVTFNVMQHIMDEVYKTECLADSARRVLLDGFKFGSSADFPGAVSPPTTPTTHTATISASFPDTFGRDTQQWTLPARKPTGCYLAPGSIVTVEVPTALVGRGIKVRVGAHSWDNEASDIRTVARLSRATIAYDLDAAIIQIASPYGGGIYFEIPMGLELGVFPVKITGAVRSPYFSMKSFHTTSDVEWRNTERNHPAPWADFQTDKFMMQVPASWVNLVDNPTARMADWDAAMDAMNDLMGFPRIRGKETMYLQIDLALRAKVHAPGYPAVNETYSPDATYNGDVDHYFVRGPRFGAGWEFHEQGHAYDIPKLDGERESTVNLLDVAVANRMFGATLDAAFAEPPRTLDKTAIAWMCCFNFSPIETEMQEHEKGYYHKGHAKYVDIVRLFGWQALDRFWHSINLDEESGNPGPQGDDGQIIRLCEQVGADIRPLFHFWGVFPDDPAAMQAAITAAGLTPSPEIYHLLRYYKTIVPTDNTAFQTFAFSWWEKQPGINGYSEERNHARQWDSQPLYTQVPPPEGNQQRSEASNPGEIYNENSAADIRSRVQEIIDIYYPDGNPDPDGDDAPPGPDPMTFANPPAAQGHFSITMTATTATDPSGVEYYFECTAGGGKDSGWQDGPAYTDSGLWPGTQATYRVRARDKSSNRNQTVLSMPFTATTTPATPTTTHSNSPINWSTPAYDITGASDIRSTGVNRIAGVNFGLAAGNTTTVNNGSVDVAFEGARPGDRIRLSNGVIVEVGSDWQNFGYSETASEVPGDFGFVLDHFLGDEWGPSNAGITLGSLIPGRRYQIQFFVSDLRWGANIDGINVRNLNATGESPSPGIEAKTAGNRGQYVVGTFTASDELLTLNLLPGNDIILINAFTIGEVAAGYGFADWIGAYDLNGQTGFTVDPDGDGLCNGIEAFFGTHPGAANRGLEKISFVENVFTFQHPQADPPPGDVSGSYEWSLDLVNWHALPNPGIGTTVTIVATPNDPALGITTVRATVEETSPSSLFVRPVVFQN